MSQLERVALFAHNWHWLSMNDPVAEELRSRNIRYTPFTLRRPDAEYFRRLVSMREKYPTLSGFERGGIVTLMELIVRVPILGELFCALCAYYRARRILKDIRAQAIVITDDRALFYPLSVLRAARSLKIPAVLFPAETLMLVSSLEKDKAVTMSRPTFVRRCMRRVVKRFYPASVHRVDGNDAHFYQASRILPFLLWPSFLPRNPWVRGSHAALSAVAVNSAAQLEENASHGVLAARMTVTGFPPHDLFVAGVQKERAAVRSAFDKEFNAIPDRKLFLIIGTHFRGTYDPADFSAVEAEVQEAFRLLCARIPDTYQIVVKLHPNTDANQWIEYFGKPSRPIVFVHREWDAYRLIAIADAIFMFASSVVIAALATDAPIMAYKLRLASFESFYKPYRSLILLSNVKELSQALHSFGHLQNDEHREKRLEDRRKFGMFDGDNSRRFCELLAATVYVT